MPAPLSWIYDAMLHFRLTPFIRLTYRENTDIQYSCELLLVVTSLLNY
ncbi:hypothetical protein BofuT4_P095750.1 [Botrytis cinerea T4]|uniref:Uncharacterized protein n=1 Tax=Botryotinia fuckeliana (strain T4) TaxID=999810 RepID=G2YDL9_BOTF4|nr:hypothetical protein BofuT4_P095750.1 [Botrytis cinerea T4]